jgi:hypothetical protein
MKSLLTLALFALLLPLVCSGQNKRTPIPGDEAKLTCRTRDGRSQMVSMEQSGKCLFNGATFDEWDQWRKDVQKALRSCRQRNHRGRVALFDPIFQDTDDVSCATVESVFGGNPQWDYDTSSHPKKKTD